MEGGFIVGRFSQNQCGCGEFRFDIPRNNHYTIRDVVSCLPFFQVFCVLVTNLLFVHAQFHELREAWKTCRRMEQLNHIDEFDKAQADSRRVELDAVTETDDLLGGDADADGDGDSSGGGRENMI